MDGIKDPLILGLGSSTMKGVHSRNKGPVLDQVQSYSAGAA